jgi:hypothetical protein
MSDEALEVAIEALDNEVQSAELWRRDAVEQLRRAETMVERGHQGVEAAERRCRLAQEALDALRGLQAPPADYDDLDDLDEVPYGAEAAGAGFHVLHRSDDESDKDWQTRVAELTALNDERPVTGL